VLIEAVKVVGRATWAPSSLAGFLRNPAMERHHRLFLLGDEKVKGSFVYFKEEKAPMSVHLLTVHPIRRHKHAVCAAAVPAG
jgi:hypothetical protein